MRGDESANARARQSARGSVGNTIDPAVAVQIDRILAPTLKHFKRVAEKVETLNGDRQKARDKAAVRVSDLSSLDNIRQPTARKSAGANPSKAEFDALADDVRAIREALAAIATTIGAQ